MGACSSTTEVDANYLMDNNFQYSKELCTWGVLWGSRFIYASSAATYGDGYLGYSDYDSNTIQLRPLNMYGYSKHAFDLWAFRMALLNRIVGLKYFNVYGPGEEHKGDMKSMVNKAYHQIVENGVVMLFKSHNPNFADGQQLRDFMYVEDAVDVTLAFGDGSMPPGLYNCGTGLARTWKDLAIEVFASLKIKPNISYIEMPDELKENYQYETQAVTTKLRGAGYSARFQTLQEGVDAYVEELEKLRK